MNRRKRVSRRRSRKRVSRRRSRKRVSRRRKKRSKRKFGTGGCSVIIEDNRRGRVGLPIGRCTNPACIVYHNTYGNVGYCKYHKPDNEEINRRGLILDYNHCDEPDLDLSRLQIR